MNLRRRHLLLCAPLGGWTTSAWAAAREPRTAGPGGAEAKPVDAALQALLAERLRHEGVALAAARLGPDGRVALAAAHKPGTPAVDAGRDGFEIGSITKVFTGLLLADAVLRGELRLDDPVEGLLGFALRDSADQPLRFVDLATHRSGLPRLPANLQPANDADPYADYREPQMLEALRAHRATRRRDEAHEYSNHAFGVLGWLLARRTGQPLSALMQQRILAPLGLAPQGTLVRLQGHDAKGSPVPAWHFSEPTAGAGALVMSAAQLARFAQAALGQFDHPLKAAFALSLQAHSPLGPQPGVRMGLGWLLAERGAQRIATHDGGTFGFASSLWLNLDAGRGALVLSNAAVNVGDLARHLMDEASPLRDLAAERRAAQQTAVALSAEQLAPLAGVYAASPDFKLTVRTRDGKLYAQATGQGEFELFATQPRRFFAKVAPLEVEFAAEGDRPGALVVHQGGGRTRFQREGDAAPEVALPAEALRPLAGVYALNAGFKLSVRADGGRLFAQATNQGEFELFAGPDARTFVARVTPLTMRFEPGDPAPALLLQQAGRDMRFTRE